MVKKSINTKHREEIANFKKRFEKVIANFVQKQRENAGLLVKYGNLLIGE